MTRLAALPFRPGAAVRGGREKHHADDRLVDPLSALARFRREVVVPDLTRNVEESHVHLRSETRVTRLERDVRELTGGEK